jgi:hypothetical protein
MVKDFTSMVIKIHKNCESDQWIFLDKFFWVFFLKLKIMENSWKILFFGVQIRLILGFFSEKKNREILYIKKKKNWN